MKQISKREAFYLREVGKGHDVHQSKTKHPKYYATESFGTMKALDKFRKKNLIKD